MFETEVVEKLTRILCSVTFRAFYEIVCKYMVVPDRPQVTIWRMRIACWVTKATDTHSEYVILIASPLQRWLRQDAAVLHFYIHCLSCHRYQFGTRPGNARSGFRSGERFFCVAARKDQLCSLCSLTFQWTPRAFPRRWGSRGTKLAPHHHLAPKLRIGGVVFLLTVYTFMMYIVITLPASFTIRVREGIVGYCFF
jgi:hypothetical protein